MRTLLAICLFSISAFSYNYSAFSLTTGENTFAVNSYMYCDFKGFSGTDLFISYGVTDKFDFFTNISINNAPTGNVTWSAMPRYDFKLCIAAVRFSATYVAPQLHFSHDWKYARLQLNALGQFPLTNMSKPSAYAIVGPGVKLGPVDFNCEANPGHFMTDGEVINGWVRTKGTGLDIIPSIGFTIRNSMFNVALPIYEVTRDKAVTLGVWWFYMIVSK